MRSRSARRVRVMTVNLLPRRRGQSSAVAGAAEQHETGIRGGGWARECLWSGHRTVRPTAHVVPGRGAAGLTVTHLRRPDGLEAGDPSTLLALRPRLATGVLLSGE